MWFDMILPAGVGVHDEVIAFEGKSGSQDIDRVTAEAHAALYLFESSGAAPATKYVNRPNPFSQTL